LQLEVYEAEWHSMCLAGIISSTKQRRKKCKNKMEICYVVPESFTTMLPMTT
jgi:hypothetical protein